MLRTPPPRRSPKIATQTSAFRLFVSRSSIRKASRTTPTSASRRSTRLNNNASLFRQFDSQSSVGSFAPLPSSSRLASPSTVFSVPRNALPIPLEHEGRQCATRLAPDIIDGRRYYLYSAATHDSFVLWWKTTQWYQEHPKVHTKSTSHWGPLSKTADSWKYFAEAADANNGLPVIVCTLCLKRIAHPRKDGRPGMGKHLSSRSCQTSAIGAGKEPYVPKEKVSPSQVYQTITRLLQDYYETITRLLQDYHTS